MNWVANVCALYAYNEWANGRVLAAAAAAPEEELLRERDIPYGSIAADLRHIVQTQMWWHSVLAEVAFESLPGVPLEAPLTAIRRWFESSHAVLAELVAGLDEDGLLRVVGMTNRRGERAEWPRWQLLLHLGNHGTQHRAEVGLVLASLGHSPGDIDFLDYVSAAGG